MVGPLCHPLWFEVIEETLSIGFKALIGIVHLLSQVMVLGAFGVHKEGYEYHPVPLTCAVDVEYPSQCEYPWCHHACPYIHFVQDHPKLPHSSPLSTIVIWILPLTRPVNLDMLETLGHDVF